MDTSMQLSFEVNSNSFRIEILPLQPNEFKWLFYEYVFIEKSIFFYKYNNFQHLILNATNIPVIKRLKPFMKITHNYHLFIIYNIYIFAKSLESQASVEWLPFSI